MRRITAENETGSIMSIALVVVCICLAVAATYVWQHQQVHDLQNQVSTLQKQQKAAQQPSTATSPSKTAVVPQTTYTSAKSVTVTVFRPARDAVVTSPLAVIGLVPGNWSFEASFPIKLLDSTGKVVAQGSAQVLGDWMTTDLVPFSAKLTWTGTQSETGTLLLSKDNPSGLPANDDSVRVPIRFN